MPHLRTVAVCIPRMLVPTPSQIWLQYTLSAPWLHLENAEVERDHQSLKGSSSSKPWCLPMAICPRDHFQGSPPRTLPIPCCVCIEAGCQALQLPCPGTEGPLQTGAVFPRPPPQRSGELCSTAPFAPLPVPRSPVSWLLHTACPRPVPQVKQTQCLCKLLGSRATPSSTLPHHTQHSAGTPGH